jgi:3-deoxy-manno-octulosonate cytidylyltransferase (CMP-KDO synthetase)
MKFKVLAVIPARLGSTRLPNKVLLKESGKYLIQHVYEQVQKAKLIDRIIVATDSEEVVKACEEFGAECMMTSPDHQSGTDRIAEVVQRLSVISYQPSAKDQKFRQPTADSRRPLYDIVINIQGDEPEINPEHIDLLAEGRWHKRFMPSKKGSRYDMKSDYVLPVATLAERISFAEACYSQVVKVVFNKYKEALYFSRSVIPHPRSSVKKKNPVEFYRHIGIYAYKSDFLRQFVRLEQSPMEIAEGLEQLRILHHGYGIHVETVESGSARGIDTREDYDEFLEREKNE